VVEPGGRSTLDPVPDGLYEVMKGRLNDYNLAALGQHRAVGAQ
jgi:hypothetical protein